MHGSMSKGMCCLAALSLLWAPRIVTVSCNALSETRFNPKKMTKGSPSVSVALRKKKQKKNVSHYTERFSLTWAKCGNRHECHILIFRGQTFQRRASVPGWVLGGKYVDAFSLQEVPLDPRFLCLQVPERK